MATSRQISIESSCTSHRRNRIMSENSIVYGINPVTELLRAKRRRIERLYLLSGSKSPNLRRITDLLRERGMRPEYVQRDFLGNISKSSEHQGVVALCEPIGIVSHRLFLDEAARYSNILIVSNVQDPHNLGAVIRSAYLFSFNGIVLTRRNTASITPAVVKASSGAIEYVDIAIEENLPQVLIDLKRAGYKVISLDAKGDREIRDIDIGGKVAIIVGGEDAGIHKRLFSLSDYVVRIPISDDNFSLNLSVSAAIMMYKINEIKK